ncbi:MAG: aminotransferase class I and II [Caldilineaceae bacterium]|nr:aminotransferase class I and II [Caldilineaceae bacterium]
MTLKTVEAVRYVTPLREGGSLPALVEADDGQQYVMKFAGAGQGPKALVAEIIAGRIGQLLGLRVPELALIELREGLGRSEPHEEIRDLLNASTGTNLGLRYLPSALAYNPLQSPPVESLLASTIVWFDAYVTNVDRTPRNVNMLMWRQQLWLIDHGAALYFHHDWSDWEERAGARFPMIREHALLPWAENIRAVDPKLRVRLETSSLEAIVAEVPDVWLQDEGAFADVAAHRAAYVAYLAARRDAADRFMEEAIDARQRHL